MKSIISSFALFIVMFICILFSINYLNKSFGDLMTVNNKLEDAVDKDSWDEAQKYSNEFVKKWNNYSSKTAIFVDHKEMDNINNELWKLTQYTKEKNKDESLASAATIKFYINHVLKLEEFSVQNIF